MLDIQMLRNDLPAVAARLAGRGFTLDTDAFAQMEHERKSLQTRTQDLQARRNALSKQVGEAKRKGEDASAIMAEVAGLADELKANETALALLQDQRMRLALVEAIKHLPEREQYVMSMYYEHDMNLKEIAAVLKVTESRVCQLHSQSIARLRVKLREY